MNHYRTLSGNETGKLLRNVFIVLLLKCRYADNDLTLKSFPDEFFWNQLQ